MPELKSETWLYVYMYVYEYVCVCLWMMLQKKLSSTGINLLQNQKKYY